ncbi:hypothetical protein A2U01_0011821 [Trifolium medium]|uniref:Uncharacterized protein n=1 Tax=Trifolium medium TaxID=97028 RepID=A0A392MW20_9FABA|nr:hypothetical protein [Trifolium medium]
MQELWVSCEAGFIVGITVEGGLESMKKEASHGHSSENNFSHVGNSKGVATEDSVRGAVGTGKCMTDEEYQERRNRGWVAFLLQ